MTRPWLNGLLGTAPPPVAADEPRGASRTYRLASLLPETSFSAAIQAWWHPADRGYEEIVFQYLWEVGRKETRRFSVLDSAAANDAINASFAAGRAIPGGGVQLVGARAELTVATDDLAFAERRATIERRASIEAAELETMHARLVKLRDLFLSDSVMAGLWWSNGEPDRMLGLAEHAPKFDSLVSVVTGSHADPARADPIAAIIGRFLADLGPDHRTLLIGQLAKVFVSYHQPGLAQELLEA
jgi:hypothetical protein